MSKWPRVISVHVWLMVGWMLVASLAVATTAWRLSQHAWGHAVWNGLISIIAGRSIYTKYKQIIGDRTDG